MAQRRRKPPTTAPKPPSALFFWPTMAVGLAIGFVIAFALMGCNAVTTSGPDLKGERLAPAPKEDPCGTSWCGSGPPEPFPRDWPE